MVAVLFLAGAGLSAAELELAGYGGVTLPFYEQTFTVDLSPPSNPAAGIDIRQERPLALDARSGLVFAGGATVWLTGGLGIEARYDSADIDIDTLGPRYTVTFSRPFPNLRATLEPAAATVTLSALHPVSLNLRLRTGGPVRFVFSGGVSYLSDFQLAVSQPLNLSVSGIALPPGLDLGTVTAQALSRPDADESRFGGNVGIGLQIKISDNLALVGEGRVFAFPKQVLTWDVTQTSGLVTLPDEAIDALEQQLQPIRFNPAYFHLIGGLALSF
jgi:opacity protein-like surface antigen